MTQTPNTYPNIYNEIRGHFHPHWLEHDPCYGDFEPAIHECLTNIDMLNFVALNIMFLQQYNPEDEAGKYFYTWLSNFGAEDQENLVLQENQENQENQTNPVPINNPVPLDNPVPLESPVPLDYPVQCENQNTIPTLTRLTRLTTSFTNDSST